ncbi:membrane protein NosY precursor [Halosimplex carlsbadense 2-9-1]|uniref:Membrane protein NosY n=1 Tax=Halosimplex carlsbadense 2-9-1 TaxID=797114 RepID=M0CGC5_9EURY|nr:LEA type 2 family protein [Halosimplex carlsbadense]ELZ22306.1 membrane protein NosY precursor [Halosimplex carlsbadense 2-9-1]
MVSKRRIGRFVAGAAGGCLALAVVLAVLVGTGVLAAPTVGNVESEWGTVTANATAIETAATVTNPNPVGVPGVVDVAYEARLNDVVLARGERSGVGFPAGTSQLRLSTEMANDRIADWWVAHVTDGETSELRVAATVSGPGFSRRIPAQRSTVETDLLGGFATDGDRTVRFRGDPFLVVGNQTAAWGDANASVTPLSVTSTVENVHDYPVALDGVDYAVEMNGVTLAEGRQRSGVDVAPGETGTLDVRMGLDSARMADWWATHVRADERSTLSVELYGLVERDGEYQRVPIRVYERSLELETDVLGGGAASVSARSPPERDTEFERPRIVAADREWGAVTDATTAIRTRAAIDNPNDDERLNELLALDTAQRTAINDITVARGGHRTEGLDAGRSAFAFVSEMNNSKVPAWWARHLDAGERSTITTTPSVRADLGFTTFDVAVPNRTSEVRTDLLVGMGGESETVAVSGEPALVVNSEAAEWGDATPETAPILVNATLANERAAPVDVTAIDYRVALNDVVLADRTVPETYRVAPGESRSVGFEMALDNGRMDEWWVTHVRNGESTNVSVAVTATVETPRGTETVELDSLSRNGTMTTDVFG